MQRNHVFMVASLAGSPGPGNGKGDRKSHKSVTRDGLGCEGGFAEGEELSAQCVHTELGPCFEAFVGGACELFEGVEAEVGEGGFVGGDLIRFEVEAVDDAEVDGADGVAVVVDGGEEFLSVSSLDADFFPDFAFDSCHVGVEVVGEAVHGVDVAADADGHFVVQARFAAGASAGVGEDAALVAEDGVGDDLFVFGGVFGEFAVDVVRDAGLEEGAEVLFGGEAYALKAADGVECGAGDDEYLFSMIA